MPDTSSQQARMQRAYAMIRGLDLPTVFPTRLHLPGVVDIHVHVGQNLTDPLDLARRATQAGMRALVFKTVSPAYDLARTVNAALAALDLGSEVTPVECHGGFVLETTGPPNVAAAQFWLRKGCRMLWFATGSAANHLERAAGMPRRRARRSGQFLLRRGAVIPEAIAVIEAVAAAGRALSFGHTSPEEMFALAAETERRGLQRAFVDHPFNPVIGLDVAGCQRIASHGVFINFTAAELAPMFGIDPYEIAAAIRAIGVERVVLSSDSGHPTMGDAAESMRLWQVVCRAQGFTDAEITRMTCTNPAYLLGLDGP